MLSKINLTVELTETYNSNIKTNVQQSVESVLYELNGNFLTMSWQSPRLKCSDHIKNLKDQINLIDLTREQDKKALADANEAVRVARERLDKVRSGGIFGGVNERRVIEKTETLRITTIRQEEAASTRN